MYAPDTTTLAFENLVGELMEMGWSHADAVAMAQDIIDNEENGTGY